MLVKEFIVNPCLVAVCLITDMKVLGVVEDGHEWSLGIMTETVMVKVTWVGGHCAPELLVTGPMPGVILLNVRVALYLSQHLEDLKIKLVKFVFFDQLLDL